MQFSKAQKLFSEAIASSPKNARAHYGLGKALCQQGLHAEAVKSVETALKLRPNPAWKTYLGRVYAEKGDRREAERLWRAVVESNPDFGPALRELSKLSGETE